jgi:hypothetical protein
MPDERNVAKPVAKANHGRDPTGSTNNIEGKEARVVHLADAGNEGRERPDDGHELGINDCLAAVPLIKRMRPIEVLAPEYFGIALEQTVTKRRSQQEADAVARDRRDCEEQDDHTDLELARSSDDPDREQERIARQKETDQETALGEHDEKEQQISDPDMGVGRDEVTQNVRVRQTSVEGK